MEGAKMSTLSFELNSPEGVEKRFSAVGKFVLQFAAAEQMLFLTVATVLKMHQKIAQAVFSGLRAENAIQTLNRIMEVSETPDKIKSSYAEIFAHFKSITDVRNSILHYGINTEGGEAVTSNKLVALTPLCQCDLRHLTSII
jgi:hypothetical protein